jgi:hypothetical protein
LLGQTLRGGRSWRPERKLGAGAKRSGNETEDKSDGGGTDVRVLSSGVIEQKSQHRLHLANPSEWWPLLVPDEPEVPVSCPAC